MKGVALHLHSALHERLFFPFLHGRSVESFPTLVKSTSTFQLKTWVKVALSVMALFAAGVAFFMHRYAKEIKAAKELSERMQQSSGFSSSTPGSLAGVQQGQSIEDFTKSMIENPQTKVLMNSLGITSEDIKEAMQSSDFNQMLSEMQAQENLVDAKIKELTKAKDLTSLIDTLKPLKQDPNVLYSVTNPSPPLLVCLSATEQILLDESLQKVFPEGQIDTLRQFFSLQSGSEVCPPHTHYAEEIKENENQKAQEAADKLATDGNLEPLLVHLRTFKDIEQDEEQMDALLETHMLHIETAKVIRDNPIKYGTAFEISGQRKELKTLLETCEANLRAVAAKKEPSFFEQLD